MNRISLGWKRQIGTQVVLCLAFLPVGRSAEQQTSADASGSRQGTSSRGLSVQEILSRMLEKNRERSAALEHYTTDRTYKIAYTGTGGGHAGELQVRAEYLGGERKKLTVLSQTGSPFLCNRVLRKLVEDEAEESSEANQKMMLTAQNYEFSMVGEGIVQGVDFSPGAAHGGAVKTWLLRVTPKRDNKYGYKGTVWISQDDFAVVRIVGEPAKPPSFLMERANFDSLYARHGEMWLPSRNESATHLRFGGDANLTINYGSYPQIAARAVSSLNEASLRVH